MVEVTGRLALEAIQREALTVLYENLNNKIASLNSTWQTEDEELYNTLGLGNPEWFVEEIDPENFYPGTIPSLINAPIEKYPNVCVIAYIARPKITEDDTAEIYRHTLAIEIMVKAGPYDPTDFEARLNCEREVNSRIQKTIDAAHLTILDNRGLNNLVSDLPAPIVTIGDIFIRTLEQGHGSKWCWQGGSLEYLLDKYVNFV